MFRTILAPVLLVAVTACQTMPAAPDEAMLQVPIEALEAAWAAGDGAAFGDAFTDDALFTTWFGLTLNGREAISQGHQEIFDTIYAGTALSAEPVDIVMLDERTALVRMDGWVYRSSSMPPDTDAQVRPLAVLRWTGSTWKIAAFQNTPVQQPAALGDIRGDG